LDDVLGSAPLKAFTPKTTIDRAVLRRQIDEIRVRGCAINEEEITGGACGISAPLFGDARALAGCIALGIPGMRFKSKKNSAIKAVIAAATEISRNLGVEDWQDAVRTSPR